MPHYRDARMQHLGTAVMHVFQTSDIRVGSCTLGVDMNSQWRFLGFYHVDGEIARSHSVADTVG